MKIKTNELTGAALDWAVAKCEGRPDVRVDDDGDLVGQDEFDYSTDWAQGGPIIEREKVCADFLLNGQWLAVSCTTEKQGYGPTPLIAAMRCYVASKLSDEVEIPNKLI